VAEEKKARKAAPGKKKASSAKKAAPAKKAATSAKRAPAKKAAKSSAKKAASGAAAVTHEDIAQHAYHIHEREGGDANENWLRAERELSEG